MCGRFTLKTPIPEIARYFGADLLPEHEFSPRFNLAPTEEIVAVRWSGRADERELCFLHWGLVPSWVKDRSDWPTLINARAESLHRKPAFEDAARDRRCLVVADGFFEWRAEAGGKQPYYVRRADGEPMAFAGLWERWEGAPGGPPGHEAGSGPAGRAGPRPEGGGDPEAGDRPSAEAAGQLPALESGTIVTTDANGLLRPLHDRMPVILLSEEARRRWLDPEVRSYGELEPLLGPASSDALVAYPVSRRVNTTANDDPSLIEPLAEGPDPWAEAEEPAPAEGAGAAGGERDRDGRGAAVGTASRDDSAPEEPRPGQLELF